MSFIVAWILEYLVDLGWGFIFCHSKHRSNQGLFAFVN